MKKKPSLKTLRNKADKLLTPLIKKKHPHCLLRAPNCSVATQVAHHHVHKSKSNRLRYDIDNLIPLCNHCHLVLHNNESYWAGVILQKKGIKWFNELVKKNNEIVKVDRFFYEDAIERLNKLHNEYI